jgi:hypothetical protein
VDLPGIASWIENGAIGTAIRESSWAFPTIETCHVIAIVTVVGTIMILDLRLLGLASRQRAVTEVMSEVLPWTWWSFLIAAISGSLLFTSKALEYYNDGPFRAKMLLLIFAGINMGIFERITKKGIVNWDREESTPWSAKIAGGMSLVLWVAIVACGRWIGFTTS